MRKCIASDTSQYDLWGKLICSNFKISFITDDPMPLQKFHYRNIDRNIDTVSYIKRLNILVYSLS